MTWFYLSVLDLYKYLYIKRVEATVRQKTYSVLHPKRATFNNMEKVQGREPPEHSPLSAPAVIIPGIFQHFAYC